VGKTLLASYLAREVTKHGWTYIYVKDAEDLYNALRWAVRYQPVVVQAEDVDRVAGGEHRTDEINELLNQIDGIDSKATDIITVLTSNHPEHINSAMRRPGRIDLVLEVNPPDAETVQRMLVAFCGKRLQKGTDLSEASAILNGEIPARIKEAVERAGMESLRRTGDPLAPISGTDLVSVAHEVIAESKLFRKPETNGRDGAAAVAHGFGEASKAINDVILRQQLAS
jgi:transitional endoplasmic reticulum ATPase